MLVKFAFTLFLVTGASSAEAIQVSSEERTSTRVIPSGLAEVEASLPKSQGQAGWELDLPPIRSPHFHAEHGFLADIS